MNIQTRHGKSLLTHAAILAMSASPAAAQFGGPCGLFIKPEEVAQALQQQQAGMYTLPSAHSTAFCFVRVKVHIVRRADGTGGLGEWEINAALGLANLYLGPASRTFLVPQSDVDYIDDDSFYHDIDTAVEVDALREIRPQASMLNIYFTEHLADENGDLCGVSSFTFSSPQGIAMDNQCVAPVDGRLSHQVGHYFDLFHTHEPTFGFECVNGSNCAVAGDLVCDTPAHPGLDFGPQLPVVFNSSYHGSWPAPFDSFNSALAATPTGGALAIARAGANEGPIMLSRKMIIYNSGPETGVVRLGAP